MVALAVGVLAAPAAAWATVPEPAEGTFTVEGMTVTAVRPAGETCHVELTATFAFAGTLAGSFTAPFSIQHHGSCVEPAAETFQASGTYAGTVTVAGSERTGTFEFTFAGTIDTAGNAEGKLVVRHGTGELEGLHGLVELTGLTGVGGTYSGSLHLEPGI